MKVLSVGELKTHFSDVLKQVIAGEEVGISYGKRKEIVARLVPKSTGRAPKRKLGILEGKAAVVFKKDYKLTLEEFLGS